MSCQMLLEWDNDQYRARRGANKNTSRLPKSRARTPFVFSRQLVGLRVLSVESRRPPSTRASSLRSNSERTIPDLWKTRTTADDLSAVVPETKISKEGRSRMARSFMHPVHRSKSESTHNAVPTDKSGAKKRTGSAIGREAWSGCARWGKRYSLLLNVFLCEMRTIKCENDVCNLGWDATWNACQLLASLIVPFLSVSFAFTHCHKQVFVDWRNERKGELYFGHWSQQQFAAE